MKKKHTTQSGLFSLRPLLALFFCTVAVCSMIVTGTLLAFWRSDAPAQASQRTLTFAERAAYQRAIEEVYWHHRIWPKQRPDPKPPLDAVMSQAQLEKKVADYLRSSRALEDYWQRPITAEQLQGEMDRMAEQTKQPQMLRELFQALGSDPFVIAECLARPVLAERLFNSALRSDHATLAVSQRINSRKTEATRFRGYRLPIVATGLKIEGTCIDAWAATSTVNAPTAREFHTAIWTGSEMIIWGGLAGGYSNSGGRYNPATDSWTPTGTINAPAGREGHTAVWTGSEMIVWGGTGDGGNVLNTGGRYNPVTDSWTPTSTTDAPAARYSHVAVWTGGEMIVWGGWATNPLNTGGRYNPSTDTWTATSTTNAPSARYNHTGVWTGSEMIVWGGEDFAVAFNTGGRYNPGTDSWTATSTTNAPSARIVHTAVWTGNEMIVWGGDTNGIEVNTGGRYNPVGNTWLPTSLTNAPNRRAGHTSVWSGSEMLLWGGYDGFDNVNTGARYDPGTDSWAATSTINAPSARDEHKAVWTGSEMIVWGGIDDIGRLTNTGGRYCGQYPSPTPTATATATPTPTGSPTPPLVHEAWVARYNGSGDGVDEAKAIAVDGSGNVYVTGFSDGNGGSDCATIKYSQSGQEEWVARYRGPGNEGQGNAIAVDAAGNVYVTGGIAMCQNPAYATIKTVSAGHQQWVATYGDGEATAIAVDNSGNVYVTGESGGVYTTIKYNPVGEEQWVAVGPPDGLIANGLEAIAIDEFGNVYVTGTTNGHGPGGDFDYGTVKYNSAGQQQWLATYNGPMDGWDQARGIAVDGSGNVYVTGRSEGLGTGRFDYATVKYNPSGQEQWVARYNGPGFIGMVLRPLPLTVREMSM